MSAGAAFSGAQGSWTATILEIPRSAQPCHTPQTSGGELGNRLTDLGISLEKPALVKKSEAC